MAEGVGYNPYRKANGEFASKEEVGDLNEKLASDIVDARDAGNEDLAFEIENYAMTKHPESPLGRKLLEDTFGATQSVSVSPNPYAEIGIRDLQKAAKDTQNSELQNEIAKRGNSAALKNLARNPNATTEALEAAYIRTDDDSVRQEIAVNLNSDTRIMHPSHVAYAASENYRLGREAKDRFDRERNRYRALQLASSDTVDDATVAELKRLNSEEKDRYGFSNLRSAGPLVDAAMANPHNLISEDAALDYATDSPRAASIALEAGRISPNKIGFLTADTARFESTTDPAVLSRAAELSASGHWDLAQRDPWGEVDEHGREGRDVAARILANEHTPAEALNHFAGNPRVDQVALYNHPNLEVGTRNVLAVADDSVRSHLRIEKAQAGRSRAELQQELKLSGGSTSTQTGYHQTDIQLDRAKIADYGLSKEDVEKLMGGQSHFYSYNPDTGRYSGSMDSSG